MASIASTLIFSSGISSITCRNMTLSYLSLKNHQKSPSSMTRRLAALPEQATSISVISPVSSPTSGFDGSLPSHSAIQNFTEAEGLHEEVGEDDDVVSGSIADYFEQAKVLIRSDGGSVRWFSPVECGGGESRLKDAPLLLYLPGIDGTGLGLLRHHRRLGKIFEVRCLHIPVADRSSFRDLLNLVESTVRSEHRQSPNRPIYLVGETLGSCLALAIAARNPEIDLMLILANPATSFSKSQMQLLIPALEFMPSQHFVSVPYLQSFIRGNLMDILRNAWKSGIISPQILQAVSSGLLALPSYSSVINEILPKGTFLWRMKVLETASAYANSRVRAVKSRTLILTSGRDSLLPSKKEGERLQVLLPKCELRNFSDNGHFLFLEDGVDLVYTIKCSCFYRRGKSHDYVADYLPPTPSDFRLAYEPYRWLETAASPVLLSTLEDGKIVRGLEGIPSEGPVLFVGYHMFLGLELGPLVGGIYSKRNILVRGLSHPMFFSLPKEAKFGPDVSMFHDSIKIMGATPVTGKNMFKLFSSKSHVLLYPGGVREALHRKGEEYKLFWPDQSEFVRMAARFGVKIVPFGAVGEDDILDLVVDYNDLSRIQFFKEKIIDQITNDAPKLSTRANVSGEVANQDMYYPGVVPKIPGRFYLLFGKPIETQGRKEELKDKEKAQELYLHVKSETEKCLGYLREKREHDPYRSLIARTVYQATHGFTSEIPTFEL